MVRYNTNIWESLYTKEKEGTSECEVREVFYEDQCGECQSYEVIEPAPFRPKRGLVFPIFIDTTFNSLSYYRAKLKDYEVVKGKLYVYLDVPFQVGDIIQIDNDHIAFYYIKRRDKRSSYKGFKFELVRIDGSEICDVDLQRMKRARILKANGSFSDKKTSCKF